MGLRETLKFVVGIGALITIYIYLLVVIHLAL